jgi:cell division protein FtsL
MKKITALSLLILANIVILAHAVIPHYHHNRIPVAIINISHTDDNTEHSDAYHTHANGESNHGDHSTDDECALHKLYFNTDNQDNLSSINPITSGSNNHDFPMIYLFIPAESESLYFKELYPDPNYYLFSFYSHYITHFIGLRAPPVC